MESIDFIGLGAIVAGGLMFFAGWIWLIVSGFKNGGITWGILIIIFNWFAGVVFCLVKKTGWTALILMTVGGLIFGVGITPFISKLIGSLIK